MRRGGWIVLIAVLGVALIVIGLRDRDTTSDPRTDPPARSQGTTAEQGLPREALETVKLIREGGPFPYPRDGIVFMNRERLLPQHERGYWHEYTVPTPGESGRGARRIVAGRGGELYYSDDHYASFTRVKEKAR